MPAFVHLAPMEAPLQPPPEQTMRGFYLRRGKRALDVALAGLGLVVLAPVMAAVALLVRMRLGSPVLFRQARCGLHGLPFDILKFRTMTVARDRRGRPLPDAVRLTRLGRFLRATSLDELPELINVLRGEMGLVGPRPLLAEYAERYSSRQARRHKARPGLTGWAQVNGRNATTWDERFELDIWYVEHRSAWVDLNILARTVLMVFSRKGVSARGHATMPIFMGNSRERNERAA